MASFDNLQIDLTLNYEDFMKKISEARERFNSLFSDAEKRANNVTEAFNKITNKMQNFSGKSTSGIGRLVSEFKGLDDVSEKMADAVTSLYNSFKMNGNVLDQSDLNNAVSSMQDYTNEIRFSEEQIAAAYQSLDELQETYVTRNETRLRRAGDAADEFGRTLNPLLTKQEQLERTYDEALERGINLTERLQVAENNRADALQNLWEAQRDYEEAQNKKEAYAAEYDINDSIGYATSVGDTNLVGVDTSTLDRDIQIILNGYKQLSEASSVARGELNKAERAYAKTQTAFERYSTAVEKQTARVDKAYEKSNGVLAEYTEYLRSMREEMAADLEYIQAFEAHNPKEYTTQEKQTEEDAAWAELERDQRKREELYQQDQDKYQDYLDKKEEEAVTTAERIALQEIEAQEKAYQEEEKAAKKAAEVAQKEAERTAKKIEDETLHMQQTITSTVNSLFSKFNSIVATLGLNKVFKESVQVAEYAEKAGKRLSAVYGNVADSARVAAKEIANIYGMSTADASTQLGTVGNLLTSYGLTKTEALELSQSIVGLGADLASFTGGTKTASEAVNSLTQAMLGNYRATRSLGISITETEVKAFAKEIGLATDSLTQSELALLRYKVIVDQAKNALGDFARNQDSYYNATQQFNAALQDLKATFGEDLLPIITKVTQTLTELIDRISNASVATKAIITGILAAVSAMGVTTTVFTPLIANFKVLTATVPKFTSRLRSHTAATVAATEATKGFNAAATATNAITSASKIGVIIEILAGIVTATGYVIAETKKATEEARNFGGRVADLQTSVGSYNKTLKEHKENLDAVTTAMQGYNEEAARILMTSDVEATISAWRKAKEYVDDLKSSSETATEKWLKMQQSKENAENALAEALKAGDVDTAAVLQEQLDYYDRQLPKAVSKAMKAKEDYIAKNAEYISDSKALAQLMYDNDELLKGLFSEEDLAQLEVYNNRLEKTKDISVDIEEILKAGDYNAENWASKIKQAQNSLDSYSKARLENEGEYRAAIEYSIDALNEESKVYVDSIEKALRYEEAMYANAAKDNDALSADYINEAIADMQSITKAVSDGRLSIEDARTQLAKYGELSTEQYVALLTDMLDHNSWYQKSREALELEYSDNIYKYREQLATKLEALENRENKTLEGRRTKDLNNLEKSYREALETIYSAHGGAEGIVGTDEELLSQFEHIKELFENGYVDVLEVIENADTGNFVRLNDLLLNGDEVASYFTDMRKAYESYMTGYQKINESYDNERKDAVAEQEAAISTLRAEGSKDRIKIYKAEMEALASEEQERIRNAEDKGEDTDLIKKEYALRRKVAIDDFVEETNDIRREQNRAILEAQKALTTDAQRQYDIDKALLDDELQYELAHIKETGKDELTLREEYAYKEIALARTKARAIREAEESVSDNNKSRTRASIARWNTSSTNDPTGFVQSTFDSLYSTMNDYDDVLEELQRTVYGTVDNIIDKFGKDLPEGVEDSLAELNRLVSEGDFIGAEALVESIEDTYPEVGAELKKQLGTMFDDLEALSKQRAKAIGDAIADALVNALSSIGDIITKFEDNQITSLKNQLAEMEDAQSALQEAMEKSNKETNENMTVAQKDALKRQEAMDEDELARLEEQIAEQEALIEEEERKQFDRQKAFDIAEATIAGIKAAVDAYASMAHVPYVGAALGAAAAAAVTAFTAAQVAAIAAQPYPSYAVGAYELPQDQTAQVHKGEMIVPKPFADEIRDNGGFGSSEVVVNVYGATDEVTVEENSGNNTQQIDVYLTKRVKQMVLNGELDNSLQSRYAISRNGRKG